MAEIADSNGFAKQHLINVVARLSESANKFGEGENTSRQARKQQARVQTTQHRIHKGYHFTSDISAMGILGLLGSLTLPFYGACSPSFNSAARQDIDTKVRRKLLKARLEECKNIR